jgi:8-oxo-dGTP pyrophosphatase MutT (NUDIX family)
MSNPEHLPGVHTDSGAWARATWKFYRSSALPVGLPCTAAALIAFRHSPDNPEVVLTLTHDPRVLTDRNRTWELPAGHVEEREDPLVAAMREAAEEAGVVALRKARLLGYRAIMNEPGSLHPDTGKPYPPATINPYYVGEIVEPLGTPTDTPTPAYGSFSQAATQALARLGMMTPMEAKIIGYGFEELSLLWT